MGNSLARRAKCLLLKKNEGFSPRAAGNSEGLMAAGVKCLHTHMLSDGCRFEVFAHTHAVLVVFQVPAHTAVNVISLSM